MNAFLEINTLYALLEICKEYIQEHFDELRGRSDETMRMNNDVQYKDGDYVKVINKLLQLEIEN